MLKANSNLHSLASNSHQLMAKAQEDQVADINSTVNVFSLLMYIAHNTLNLSPKALQSLETTEPTK